MSTRTYPAPSAGNESLSGFNLLLLEGAEMAQASAGRPQAKDPLHPPKGPLHRQLISLCLHNPYWNDFRILHHFERRRIPLGIEALHRLKTECGLDNREAICNTLLRLALHGGLKLNDNQLRFIEKYKPEFRDRDLTPSQPGELFAYESLFGRGVGRFGRMYVHLFVDLFTGYAFGVLSQQRSLDSALNFLIKAVLPLYLANHYPVQTILHSTSSVAKTTKDISDFNRLEAEETFSRLGIQWQPLRRKFGVMEKFERSLIMDHFFEAIPADAASPDDLAPLFAQCLVRYNSANRLFGRYDLLLD